MAATLAELLGTRTVADEEQLLLSVFQSEGFPVSDWNVGGAARTMAKAIANGLYDKSQLIEKVTAGGLVPLAKALKDANGAEVREWLDLLAVGFYDLYRFEATRTVQRCTLECQAGLGPLTVSAGFIVRAPSTGNRYTYQGSDVVVPDGGTNTIDVIAEEAGSTYADPAGSITEIVTPLPGLTVSNPAEPFGGLDTSSRARKTVGAQGTGYITPTSSPAPALIRSYTVTVTASGNAGTSGTVQIDYTANGVTTAAATLSPIPTTYAGLGDGITLAFANGAGAGFIVGDVHTFQTPGTPILQQGSDTETNEALAQRCFGRWPSLALNAIQDKYVAWIRQCSLENGYGIEKITVRPSATVAGVADILVATATGAPSGGTVTALQTYVNARDGIVDKGSVVAASNANVTPAGTVTVKDSDLASVQAAADEAWRVYVAALDIGGDVRTGTPGVVRLNELAQALMDAGAIDVTGLQLNGAATNLALAYNEVAVIPAGGPPSIALTWATVA